MAPSPAGRPNEHLTRTHKYLYTANCCLAYFAYGITFALYTDSLLDIKDNINTTFEEASYGLIVVPIFGGISFLLSKLLTLSN